MASQSGLQFVAPPLDSMALVILPCKSSRLAVSSDIAQDCVNQAGWRW